MRLIDFAIRTPLPACHAGGRRRAALAALLLLGATASAFGQQGPLQPGEAVVTRFSGTTSVAVQSGQATIINPDGASASIIDIRSPGRPPAGDHWINEPQRQPVTARAVGQVFGVALDTESAPNIYLAATAAFGLHRTPDNATWMEGMWGTGGGPGTIYRLDARTGYQPRPFAHVTLNGRPNSGAALGNIAYDRWHQQLLVSDLETGMIHRIRASDGADLGHYDHGVQGRSRFLDAEGRQQRNLPPIPFDPNSQARIADCPSGQFQYSPECWNIAQNGRRVWGLGVGRTAAGGEVRLYYSVASGPDLGEAATWNSLAEDEKRNSVWSIRLGPDGGFDVASVRREFLMPDFFFGPQDVARAGLSRPVSDITFPKCTDRPIMLVAERGGIRNIGLDNEYSFATPHELRALRYELHQDGVWRPVGRYDVGSYNRLAEGAPYLFANCAGGAAFGYGYTPAWTMDARQLDQFVWMTGDALCSAKGLCKAPPGRAAVGGRPLRGARHPGHEGEHLRRAGAGIGLYGDEADERLCRRLHRARPGLFHRHRRQRRPGRQCDLRRVHAQRRHQGRRHRHLRAVRGAAGRFRAGDGAAAGHDLRARTLARCQPRALGVAPHRIQPLPLRLALAGDEPQSLGLALAGGLVRTLAAGIVHPLATRLSQPLAARLGEALAARLGPALAAGIGETLATGLHPALAARLGAALAAGIGAAFPTGIGEASAAWLRRAFSAGLAEAPPCGLVAARTRSGRSSMYRPPR